MRTVRFEPGVYETVSDLDIDLRRFDELMERVEKTLCYHPEKFVVLTGTKISWCRTNEFVGMRFEDIPRLTLYFRYDQHHVYILFIEECTSESYGL